MIFKMLSNRWRNMRILSCFVVEPDKPGTTGEILSILLHSLGGLEQGRSIQKGVYCVRSIFSRHSFYPLIHDVARIYGSPCWNLFKVIPCKNFSRIYTMCLPVDDAVGAEDPPAELADFKEESTLKFRLPAPFFIARVLQVSSSNECVLLTP